MTDLRRHLESTALIAEVASPRRHWHLVERRRVRRLLAGDRVQREAGFTSSHEAYRALTARAGELLLEGCELDPSSSNDRSVLLADGRHRIVIEVSECWDHRCVAALPPRLLSKVAAIQTT